MGANNSGDDRLYNTAQINPSKKKKILCRWKVTTAINGIFDNLTDKNIKRGADSSKTSTRSIDKLQEELRFFFLSLLSHWALNVCLVLRM